MPQKIKEYEIMTTPDNDTFVRTFARGLQVVEVLGGYQYGANIANIARDTGLSRSVVKRYLLTLTHLGYTAVNGRRYTLTSKTLDLGLAYLYSFPFWRQAQMELEELSQDIQQSCAMSILSGNEIVYVVRVTTYKILPASPTLGSRLPAHAVSMGRMLLAEAEEGVVQKFLDIAPLQRLTNQTVTDKSQLLEHILTVREKGYAWVDGELNESICGLAVIIKDLNGVAQAAINVSLPSGKFDEEDAVSQYLASLRAAAARIRSTL